jgi:Zn-finger nucleic acid-binding protein
MGSSRFGRDQVRQTRWGFGSQYSSNRQVELKLNSVANRYPEAVNILCPKCHELMVIVDRQGIHIDYCSNCHGVYLDRGELEKLIEMSSHPRYAQGHHSQGMPYGQQGYGSPAYGQPAPPQRPPQPQRHYDSDYDYNYRSRKRKGGFLSEIFDFD